MINLDNEYKQVNVSNPVDRKILIGILDVTDCWIKMADLGDNYILSSEVRKLLTHKASRVMILLQFSCEHKITINFLNFDTSINSRWTNLEYLLEFRKCSVIMKQMNAFLMTGSIRMLHNSFGLIKTEPETNCLFASDLQVIRHEILCENDNLSETDLFWNSCKQTFPRISVLAIYGCMNKKSRINPESLCDKFPNLGSLVLQSVNLSVPLLFPWTKSSQSSSSNRLSRDILKAFFVTYKDIYFYNMFPVNSLLLIECTIDMNSLYFKGETDMVALTEMALQDLKPTLFQNIIIQNTLNLAKNKLETIHPNLLRNQHKLEYLFLQDNKLTHITQSMFANLKMLSYINLAHNRIAAIESDPFKDLHHLKEIDLQNNTISHIPIHMFKDQDQVLEYLALRNNPIMDIPLWPLYAPFLRSMEISHSNITGDSIVKLLNHVNKLNIAEKLVDDQMNLQDVPQSSGPIIDLSFNQITTIPSANMTSTLVITLKYLFQNFFIDFQGNPFTCNCDTSVIQDLVRDKSVIELMLPSLSSWMCVKPTEFKGRPMWGIANSEKYCPISTVQCPQECRCYKRKNRDTVIVDCRNTMLFHMPRTLPKFKLELWLQNSNISEIISLPYLENVTVLNLAKNQLKEIAASVIIRLKSLQTLHLQSNHLTSIPVQIRSLKLETVTISGNHFICDCTNRWMKHWLLNKESLVSDWADVTCLDQFDKLQQLIAIPDSQFICKKDNTFSTAQHVFLPSVIIGSILFVLVVICLMIYFQRFNLKVLLFIHFNLHPFDKHSDRTRLYTYDAVVIYATRDRVLKVNIVNHLLAKGYRIADFYENSLIGYTYIENIEKLISCSNKVILIVSEVSDKLIQSAWSIAYDRALLESLKSIILIADESLKKQELFDASARQFLKSNNFIDRKAKLLKEKVEYLMPNVREVENNGIEMEPHEQGHQAENDEDGDTMYKVLISYPDQHHLYVRNEIIPILSANKMMGKILDMEFTPGADIRDELPRILDNSNHLMFIFSEDCLHDDVRSYILSQAITKTQLENHNFLLLCTAGKIYLNQLANDLNKYVENYVTVSLNDPLLTERILVSIRHNNSLQREDNVTEDFPLI